MRCVVKIPFIVVHNFIIMSEMIASIRVLDKGLVSLQRNSIGLQLYVDIENIDRHSGCSVEYRPRECCLSDGDGECTNISVYGGTHFVKPKDRDTLILIYPSLYQHDQLGYCNLILDSQCTNGRRFRRQAIEITFDTRIHPRSKRTDSLLEHYVCGRSSKVCDTLDQDSLRDCEPVDCDMKYGGSRGFYDSYVDKCVDTAVCESEVDRELPDVVYVPSINGCRDLEHPLGVVDIYAISTGSGVVPRLPAPDELKIQVKSNCSTISQNLSLLRDMMFGKLCPVSKGDVSDYHECCKSALMSIFACIAGVCALLLAFFCFIQTMTWLHRKCTDGDFKGFRDAFRKIFKVPKVPHKYYAQGVNSEVRKTLLREVMVRDIPIELRDSIVNICERMDKKVKKKKRYRQKDIGSQISLCGQNYDVRVSVTSTTSSEECVEGQIE